MSTDEKKVQQRSISHYKNNGYKVMAYLEDTLKRFYRQPVWFSRQPRLARLAQLGARW